MWLRRRTARLWSVIVVRVDAINLEPLVAIAAFDKAGIFWDGQPDAGMAQRTFAAIAGHFPMGYDLGFGGFHGHRSYPDLRTNSAFISGAAGYGKPGFGPRALPDALSPA